MVLRCLSIFFVLVDNVCLCILVCLSLFFDLCRARLLRVSSWSCSSFVLRRSFALSSITCVFVVVFVCHCASMVFGSVVRVCLRRRIRLSLLAGRFRVLRLCVFLLWSSSVVVRGPFWARLSRVLFLSSWNVVVRRSFGFSPIAFLVVVFFVCRGSSISIVFVDRVCLRIRVRVSS